MIKLYKDLEEIKVKVEEIWRVEEFINLTEDEEELYYKLYNRAKEVGASFLAIGTIYYRPFLEDYIIADFDYNNNYDEYYTMSIYRIDGKYLVASYNNIEVVRKEDFKHLLYNHAQRFGNISFSFDYPLTSKIRIIKHLYPKQWKQLLKWLLVKYEDKLVQRTFTIYEFIDFLETIEKILAEEWRQKWLEDLSRNQGKPTKIIIVV